MDRARHEESNYVIFVVWTFWKWRGMELGLELELGLCVEQGALIFKDVMPGLRLPGTWIIWQDIRQDTKQMYIHVYLMHTPVGAKLRLRLAPGSLLGLVDVVGSTPQADGIYSHGWIYSHSYSVKSMPIGQYNTHHKWFPFLCKRIIHNSQLGGKLWCDLMTFELN